MSGDAFWARLKKAADASVVREDLGIGLSDRIWKPLSRLNVGAAFAERLEADARVETTDEDPSGAISEDETKVVKSRRVREKPAAAGEEEPDDVA